MRFFFLFVFELGFEPKGKVRNKLNELRKTIKYTHTPETTVGFG